MADSTIKDALREQMAQKKGKEEDAAPPPTSPESAPAGSGSRPPFWRRAPNDDVVSFYRQFSVLIEAGHPLNRSLEILQRSVSHPDLRACARALSEAVGSGKDLDEAMSAFPWYFDRGSVAVIRAAHEAGNLSEALHYVADASEHRAEVRGNIESAMAYPIILMGITLLAVLMMLFWVVPTFTAGLTQAGAELTGLSALVVAVSDFVRTPYGIPLLAILFVAAIVALRYARRAAPETTDRMLGRFPILGRLMLLAHTSYFTDALYMLTKHGVPLPQALTLASDGIANSYLRAAIERSRAEVEAGRSLTTPLQDFPNLPPVFLEMLSVGEIAGQLPTTLGHLSRFLRRKLANASARFAVILQPVMLVVTGLIVIAVVLAFFTTYFDVLTQISMTDQTDGL